MPTILTHAVLAAGVGRTAFRERMPWRVWEIAAVCSILPDLDVIAFPLGIPYWHMFGHRGFSHSPVFALLVGLAATWLTITVYPQLAPRKRALGVYYCLVTVSHGVFDAMTNGGLGIAFLAPFHNARYFLPWTPLEVSPIGGSFFGPRGWVVLRSELLWLWLPAAAATAGFLLLRRLKPQSPQ